MIYLIYGSHLFMITNILTNWQPFDSWEFPNSSLSLCICHKLITKRFLLSAKMTSDVGVLSSSRKCRRILSGKELEFTGNNLYFILPLWVYLDK